MIVALLALLLSMLPSTAPLTAADEHALVREAVLAHLNGSAEDPIV